MEKRAAQLPFFNIFTRVRDKEKQEENMEKIGNLAGILYIYS